MNTTESKYYLLGQAVRMRLMAGMREPVAWLYNGVRLPGLPEWDKSKRPYAAIGYQRISTINQYVLRVFSDNTVIKDDFSGENDVVRITTDGALISVISYSDGDELHDVWSQLNPPSYDVEAPIAQFIWANYNVRTFNGGLLLEASEPVPVYE